MPTGDTTQENAKRPIQAEELRFTWWTGIGSGLASLAAGITAVAGKFSGLDIRLVQVLAAFAAVGVIATAIVASADVIARAWVTAAQKQTPAASGTDAPVATLSPLAMTTAPFQVRVKSEGPELFTVLAMAWDAKTQREMYLVGRADEGPKWVKYDQIDRGSYQPASSARITIREGG